MIYCSNSTIFPKTVAAYGGALGRQSLEKDMSKNISFCCNIIACPSVYRVEQQKQRSMKRQKEGNKS